MEKFKNHLICKDFSSNTIESYLFAVRQYSKRFDVLSDQSLLAHKEWLVTSFSAKTANLRITALNAYLEFVSYDGLRLKGVKVQQKPFLDNVISNQEYETLKEGLTVDGNAFWLLLVRFIACTGVRVSELQRFEVKHVAAGHMDIISKGQKLRRVYIPTNLQCEALAWCRQNNTLEGLLFKGPTSKAMTTRGIALGLKRVAEKYGINPDVVYPHSFRHLFAKNFIARNPDIVSVG